MTENTSAPIKSRKINLKIVLPILTILVLLLIYGTGFIALPIAILTSLRNSDCAAVISWNNVYTRLYPRSVQDQTLPAPVRECEVYMAAVTLEEQGTWREAYNAYQTYVSTYPTGLYLSSVREHSALILMNLVHEEVEGNQYEQALSDLTLILSTYADTSSAPEAWTLVPQVYTSWGTAFREADDFERAEQVFKEFKNWAQTHQKADLEVEAHRELAKTYLDWGLVLLEHKQYETALLKLDQAVAVDPHSQFDSAVQVKEGQKNIYIEWGNELLSQNDFSGAIDKFERAIKFANGTDNTAQNALINGQIKWGANLSSTEDFTGALDHLKIAEKSALTADTKKNVEAAFQDTYLAFSNSSGTQARAALTKTIESICKQKKKPEMPIFGLKQGVVRTAVYGADAKLPETLEAKTPGELHYVACIELEKRVVAHDVRTFPVVIKSNIILHLPFPMDRIKLVWLISLRDIRTANEISNAVLEGGTPPPFPKSKADYSNGRYEGAPPNVNDLIAWLQSVIE